MIPARLASAGAEKVMEKSPLELLVVPVPVVVFWSTTSAWAAMGKSPIRAMAHGRRNTADSPPKQQSTCVSKFNHSPKFQISNPFIKI